MLDRPAPSELQEDAKGDVYDVVSVLDIDRIARVVAYQTIIIEERLRCGKHHHHQRQGLRQQVVELLKPLP